jgi:hypothetical protein
MKCNVRVYKWYKHDHWVCQKTFLVSSSYICKNPKCEFQCTEPITVKDCGRHREGPHQYGVNGDEKWDDRGTV